MEKPGPGIVFPGGKKGWFTVVGTPTGLSYISLTEKETKLIRLLGGLLTDHELFAQEMVRIYTERPNQKFVQFKTHRLLVPPRLCECQYTGWKGSE